MAPPLLSRTHGFTLFEVLIAVLVLSLGLLGLAALQSTGMRSNHSAYHRSQATVLAYDIIDRMRGNKTVAETGGYDLALADPPPSLPADPNCVTNCSSADLADYDRNNWIQGLSAALPLGDGAVARTPVGCGPGPGLVPCIVTVTVAWDDNRSGGANQQFVMSTQL